MTVRGSILLAKLIRMSNASPHENLEVKKARQTPMSRGVRKKLLHDGPALFPEMSENPWYSGSNKLSSHHRPAHGLATLELCAGAGGQALGYEQAGIDHVALVEIDRHACATLRLNRPSWNVIEQDLNTFSGSSYRGVDIISGGLPCPPFSVAGKQLGTKDERNLFPAMIRLVDEIRPQAVMIENVRGILDAVFGDYRDFVGTELRKLGYEPGWKLMNASDFGVPQLRPRVVFVALRKDHSEHFTWPELGRIKPKTVGEVLCDLMASNGWKGAKAWVQLADEIALQSLAVRTSMEAPTLAQRALDGLGNPSAWMGAVSPTRCRLLIKKGHRVLPSEWLPGSKVSPMNGSSAEAKRLLTGKWVTLFRHHSQGPLRKTSGQP